MESNAATVARKDDIYFCPDGNTAKVVTRRDFSDEMKAAIRDLQKLDKRYNWVILLHFAIWLAAAWLSIASDSVIISIVGYLIGGLSLSTLSVLAHEASHNLFTRNPKIDRWIEVLVSLPVLFSPTGYRIMHPLHHKYTREEGDPDNLENITKSPALLRPLYVFVFFFAVYLYLIMVPVNAIRRGNAEEKVTVIVEFLGMAAIVVMGWMFLPAKYMLEGWLFPLMVAGQIANVRGIAEHGMTTRGNELTDTRTVATNPFLSFMICNINYHIEHHLYPGMPWYNLPKLHAMLKNDYVEAGSSVYTSYGKFLYDVAKGVVKGVIPNRRMIPLHIREHVCA
jgi:fatty acid desaturase